jgi:PhnB protein
MHFYERALDGKIEMLMTNGESPMAAQMPPETADRVMHARLALDDGGVLYAGDCMMEQPYEGIKGLSLTLNYDTEAQAQRVFNALSDGGQVTMPMQPAFWAKTWGMVVDRYGTPWIVNGAPLPL